LSFVKNLIYFAYTLNNCVFKDKFISQSSVKEIVEFLNNNSKNKLEIKGIYGSAKSLVYSSAVSTGINVVVMDNKEQAQFFCNNLCGSTLACARAPIKGDNKIFRITHEWGQK
jgi:hypothetical protein